VLRGQRHIDEGRSEKIVAPPGSRHIRLCQPLQTWRHEKCTKSKSCPRNHLDRTGRLLRERGLFCVQAQLDHLHDLAHDLDLQPAIERLHEEFKRRIKTQCLLPCAETAAMLFWALLASGQITMRRVDGWPTLERSPTDLDLAA
jgi:hypothetical protein